MQQKLFPQPQEALKLGSLAARWSQPDLEDLSYSPPTLEMLLTHSNPKDPEQCRPFLPLGKVGLFIAPGGTGKTQTLVQLGLAVATGRPWLDEFHVASPGGVLLALGEETGPEIRRRMWCTREADPRLNKLTAREAINANLRYLPLAGCKAQLLGHDGEPTSAFNELCGMLRADAPRDGWRLIILDPASRFMGPKCETDNNIATQFISLIELLTEVPGNPTVLLAHHTGKGERKGGKDWARGASALTDGARWVGSLQPTEDGRVLLNVDKSNYTPKLSAPVVLKYGEHGSLTRVEVPPFTIPASPVIAAPKSKRTTIPIR
jgi:RecA-family ATPase